MLTLVVIAVVRANMPAIRSIRERMNNDWAVRQKQYERIQQKRAAQRKAAQRKQEIEDADQFAWENENDWQSALSEAREILNNDI